MFIAKKFKKIYYNETWVISSNKVEEFSSKFILQGTAQCSPMYTLVVRYFFIDRVRPKHQINGVLQY